MKVETITAEQLHAIMNLYRVFCRAQDTVQIDRPAVKEILISLAADEMTINEAFQQLHRIQTALPELAFICRH